MRIAVIFLAVLGGIFVILMVALFGFGMVGARKGVELAKGAAAFSDEAIAAYGKAWDPAELVNRGSPEFLNAIAQNPQALPQLSAMLTGQAGMLVSAKPSQCSNFTYVATAGNEEVFTAQCVAEGELERATAKFNVSVVHRSDEWRLLGFFVFAQPNETDEKPGSKLVNLTAPEKSPSRLLSAGFAGRSIGLSFNDLSIAYGVNSIDKISTGAGVEISADAVRR